MERAPVAAGPWRLQFGDRRVRAAAGDHAVDRHGETMTDDYLDDAELDELLADEEEADRHAAPLLVEALSGARGAAAPDEIHRCPEVETSPEVGPDDDAITRAGFEIVTPAWVALGVLDERDRLTAVGAGVLPRGPARAWGADFDAS